jgi:hypothetical protein
MIRIRLAISRRTELAPAADAELAIEFPVHLLHRPALILIRPLILTRPAPRRVDSSGGNRRARSVREPRVCGRAQARRGPGTRSDAGRARSARRHAGIQDGRWRGLREWDRQESGVDARHSRAPFDSAAAESASRMRASEAAAAETTAVATSATAAARETIGDGEPREESGSHHHSDLPLACHGMLLPTRAARHLVAASRNPMRLLVNRDRSAWFVNVHLGRRLRSNSLANTAFLSKRAGRPNLFPRRVDAL